MRLLPLAWLLEIFLLSGPSSAQSLPHRPDSLARRLAHLSMDTARVNALNDLGSEYLKSDLNRSRQQAEQAIRLAHHLGYVRGEARGCHLLAAVYRNQGNFTLATQWALRSLHLREHLGDPADVSKSYTLLGHIAWDGEKNNQKALAYFEKALALTRTAGDSASLPGLYNHIGLMYKDAGDLPRAVANIRRAAYDVERMPASRQRDLSAFYNNLSRIALMRGHHAESFAWIDRAMTVNRRFNNWHSQTYSLENAARTHASLGHRREAEALFSQALGLARRLGADNRVRDIYQSQSTAYEWLGDYPMALRFHKNFFEKSDSLLNERKNQQLAELQTRYETTQKEDRIRQLNATNRQRTSQMALLGGGVGVLTLLLLGLAWQYRRIQRSREQIRAQSRQMNLLMKELHHRVKNNLAIVSSLLNLQAYQLDDEQAVQAVRQGQQRVEAMSLIHQRLYQTDAITRINVREYLTDLTESLLHAYGFDRDRFTLDLRVEEEWLDVDLAIPLGLVVNELATNAFKYAYARVAAPCLTIALYHEQGLTLDVTDNGPGIDVDRWREPTGSFGKQLVYSLCDQLGGRLTVETRRGTHFRLNLPATPAKAA